MPLAATDASNSSETEFDLCCLLHSTYPPTACFVLMRTRTRHSCGGSRVKTRLAIRTTKFIWQRQTVYCGASCTRCSKVQQQRQDVCVNLTCVELVCSIRATCVQHVCSSHTIKAHGRHDKRHIPPPHATLDQGPRGGEQGGGESSTQSSGDRNMV